MKQYNREDLLSQKMIRKSLPSDKIINNNTMDVDEIANRIGAFPCRFCGMPMVPYKDYGGAAIWRCYSLGCPNNVDNKLSLLGDSFSMQDIDLYYPHNSDNQWNDWMPRRLI